MKGFAEHRRDPSSLGQAPPVVPGERLTGACKSHSRSCARAAVRAEFRAITFRARRTEPRAGTSLAGRLAGCLAGWQVQWLDGSINP